MRKILCNLICYTCLLLLSSARCVFAGESIKLMITDQKGNTINTFLCDLNKLPLVDRWHENICVRENADDKFFAELQWTSPDQGPPTPLPNQNFYSDKAMRPAIKIDIINLNTGQFVVDDYDWPEGSDEVTFPVPAPGQYLVRAGTLIQVIDKELIDTGVKVVDYGTPHGAYPPLQTCGHDERGSFEYYYFEDIIEQEVIPEPGPFPSVPEKHYFYVVYKRYTYLITWRTITHVDRNEPDSAYICFIKDPEYLRQIQKSTMDSSNSNRLTYDRENRQWEKWAGTDFFQNPIKDDIENSGAKVISKEAINKVLPFAPGLWFSIGETVIINYLHLALTEPNSEINDQILAKLGTSLLITGISIKVMATAGITGGPPAAIALGLVILGKAAASYAWDEFFIGKVRERAAEAFFDDVYLQLNGKGSKEVDVSITNMGPKAYNVYLGLLRNVGREFSRQISERLDSIATGASDVFSQISYGYWEKVCREVPLNPFIRWADDSPVLVCDIELCDVVLSVRLNSLFWCIHDLEKAPPAPIEGGLATALVLDGSGSMKGQKLEKAKQAANAYIADMKTGDCGAVVAFSTNAKTLKSAQCISSTGAEKEALKGVVGSISATNSTNIAAGLSNGMDELPCNCQKAAALLLSDGMHNTGPFDDVLVVAGKYEEEGWKIFTVAFGKDANMDNLCEIAQTTYGACAPAEIENLVFVFHHMCNYARDTAVIWQSGDFLKIGDTGTYELLVDGGAKTVTFYVSYGGSKLEMQLIQPDGKRLTAEDLKAPLGRHEEGSTYEMLEVYNPQGGTWGMEIRWADPPPVGEQVNILVSEKSDIFATILPFYNEYKLGQPVNIKVQIAELVGNKRVSLKNAAVRVEVKKPGPEMIRMVQARSQKFTMYKDVMLDITRDLTLFDDGIHNDFRAGDRIFGNTFTETDENGAYLVTAVITGKKQNREKVEKTLQASFQVGPISQNVVTTSQVLQYMDKAKNHIDDKTPYKEDILRKPMQDIEQLQGGGDPLDSINKLLQGQ